MNQIMNTTATFWRKLQLNHSRWQGGFLMAATVLMVAWSQIQSFAQTSADTKLTATLGAGQIQLQLYGRSNQSYLVQTSPDLRNWTTIAAGQSDGNGSMKIADSYVTNQPGLYYRSVLTGFPVGKLPASLYRPDRILVKPKSGAALGDVNLTLGVNVIQSFPAVGNLEVLQVPPGKTANLLIASYQQSGLVQYAEHDYMVHALLTPNDYYYNDDNTLWGLHNDGSYGGDTNACIHAPEAWNIQHDATNVIVAVIDTGVRYTHQDLASNMWVSPVDGSHGINTVDNGNAPNDPNDDYGHGSHVAGILGAVGNNYVGVVGVAWSVPIMACCFLDSNGDGTISDAITCMDYARTNGAEIVNASWGTTNFTSQALYDGIDSLRQAGIIFVAACGNSATNNEVAPIYPASYNLDNIISVCATEPNDDLAAFSNYGATNVDLGAPGVAIVSCWNGSDTNYETESGTSMAAAYVSGACAIMRAHFPNENYHQIIGQILSNVDQVDTLKDYCISGGRLNLYKALMAGSPPPPSLVASFTANPANGPAPLTVQFTDTSTGNPTAWSWNFGDGSPTVTTENPTHTFTNAGNFTVTLTVTGADSATSSDSATIVVTNSTQPPPPLAANFTANPSSGQAPLTVQFTDTSTGNPTAWSWNFGDGSPTVTTENPTHTFTNAGNFTVTLTVTGAGSATSSDSATIVVTNSPQPPPPLAANFTANPSSGQAPLTVQFTDTSTGNPTAWSWNFGDGSPTVTTENPSYTFTSAGNFTVTLTVTGAGNATSSKSETIVVTSQPPPPPVAGFTANPSSGQAPLTVQFTDTSTGNPTAWSWNFGDGSPTVTEENPSYTFTSAGNFTVTLTVTGAGNATSSTSETITVTNAPPPPSTTVTVVASQPDATTLTPGEFTITRTGSGSSPLTVNFSLGGTAVNGTDYETLGTSAVIPAGSSTITIDVVPIGLLDLLQTVALTVSPSSDYTVGSPDSATVTILVSL
jgi:PKD repeat protein